MIDQILKFIKKNSLIQSDNSKVLIGLSGGPDSVFLLYILLELQKELKFELIAAHLDHQWRENSYLDEQFCAKLCSKLNVKFISTKAKDLNLILKPTGSKEDLGRKMRRYFLQKIAKEENADVIALAHHLQDQEENFFIRLIRGASLSGLVGMKPKDGIYIRPLLEINKEDILSYLHKNKINYIIDPSNESVQFLRNRIRNNVIPELNKCDARFDENFLRTLNKLKETEEFLENLTKSVFNNISFQENQHIGIDLDKFSSIDKFLQYKLIFYWLYKSQVSFELTEKFLNEIYRFLKQAGPSKHNLNPNWYIQKLKNKAIIIKNL